MTQKPARKAHYVLRWTPTRGRHAGVNHTMDLRTAGAVRYHWARVKSEGGARISVAVYALAKVLRALPPRPLSISGRAR